MENPITENMQFVAILTPAFEALAIFVLAMFAKIAFQKKYKKEARYFKGL